MSKAIEIKNLSYSYPDGTAALRGIHLDVFEGETVGIVGPNGGGKTTLLLHLNGILRGDGEIKILGHKVNNKNLHRIRSEVGVVFQEPDSQLFMPTVFDDVSFGPLNMGLSEEVVKRHAKEALEKVGMSGYENKSPHHLSWGEKKKICIATVLSMQPRILVLDEPTGNLDPRSRRNLIRVLQGIKVTRIIAGHDLEMVLQICERTVILDKGEIAGDGETKLLLRNRNLLEKHGLEVPLSLR